MLRVATAYSTVSIEALQVVTNIPPIKLIAEKKKAVYDARLENADQIREAAEYTARNVLIDKWQERWQTAKNGSWTRKLISNIALYANRRFGQTN